MNRRIIAVSVALTAGLFLAGCDDPENEDTQDPAETSIQQDQDDGDGVGDDGPGDDGPGNDGPGNDGPGDGGLGDDGENEEQDGED